MKLASAITSMQAPQRMPPAKARPLTSSFIRASLARAGPGSPPAIASASSYKSEGGGDLSAPLHFLPPAGDVPIAPVYTNCGAPPLPTLRRCPQGGALLRAFVRAPPAAGR